MGAKNIKEIERERRLILEGKTDKIPDELADEPIFLVNKQVNKIITKLRSKLKTTRQKNAERLLKQGAKWEKENVIYAEQQKIKEAEIKARKKARKELIELYRKEDAGRGLDLLRFEDLTMDDWRECEMDLKDFLESERTKMKARSKQVPTPFVTDPLDMTNVIRAKGVAEEEEAKRKKKLEEEMRKAEEERLRKEAEEAEQLRLETLKKQQEAKQKGKGRGKVQAAKVPIKPQAPPEPVVLEGEALLKANLSFDEADQQKKLANESVQTIISNFPKEGPTENLPLRLKELQKSLSEDIESGYLNRKETYNPYFYVDPKINRLQAAKNMVELFKIAEEIIMGEAFYEEDENVEEEFAGFEEEKEIDK